MHITYLTSAFLALAFSANASPTLPPSYKPYLPKRLVALEEHVVSPSLEAEVLAAGGVQRLQASSTNSKMSAQVVLKTWTHAISP